MVDVERCIECGKIIKDKSHSPYCKECDEKLDRQFDNIEDNILVYKELLDSEIETLNKFEKEDIEDLYKRVYKKYKSDGKLDDDGLRVLNKLKESFKLEEGKMGLPTIPVVKETREERLLKNNQCPKCEREIQKDFNLCPYCGYRLKKDFK